MDKLLKRLLTEDVTFDEYLKEVPLRADRVTLSIEGLAILNNVMKDGAVGEENNNLLYNSLILMSMACSANIPKKYPRKKDQLLVQLVNQLLVSPAFDKGGGYIAELDYSDESGYGYKFDVKDWYAVIHVGSNELFERMTIIGNDLAVTLDRRKPVTKELIEPLKPWIHEDMKGTLLRMGIRL